jgi:hypothetical protein
MKILKMKGKKTRRVRVSVDGSFTEAAGLGVLLKEVLQEITDEHARKLMSGYVAGKTIFLALQQNSRGKDYKTAFTTGLLATAKPPESKGTA